EDDAAQSLLIGMMLAREDITYTETHSAMEALSTLARDSNYDLILTDIRMPGMDGLDLVKVLNHLYPHIPMLTMTVHDGCGLAAQAVASGAAACLIKPFAGADLIRAIDNVLYRQVKD